MALNFPNSPTNGQLYIDSASGNRWTWDSGNTCWVSTSTFTQTITVASSAPGSPVAGQLWWNKDYGRLLVYYTDDNTSQWVDASPSDYTSQLAYNQANNAYTAANTALQNTNITLAGNLTVTGNVIANKQVVVTYTPATSVNAAITLAGANTQGGIGYADFLKATNLSGGTNPHKTFRLNSTGGIEVINSAYTAVIASITDGGYLNLPYQPKFYAYNASSSGNLTTTTWTKVALDTKEWDIGSNFNTSTNRFTAPVAGYYLFIGHVLYNQNNDNVTYGARFYKNGSADTRSSFRFYTAGAVDTRGIHEVNTTMIYSLSAGDYIELYGFCEGTADQTINGGSNLLGYLLP